MNISKIEPGSRQGLKYLRATFIGLAALVAGCSSNTAQSENPNSVSITSQRRVKIFGGIKEPYNPVTLRYEREVPMEGYSFLISPYLAVGSREERVEDKNIDVPNVLIGFDGGLKQSFGGWFCKERFGLSYNTRTFEGYDFHTSFHLGFGCGYEWGRWYVEGSFDHWSTGNKIFKWDEEKNNAGINELGAGAGVKW